MADFEFHPLSVEDRPAPLKASLMPDERLRAWLEGLHLSQLSEGEIRGILDRMAESLIVNRSAATFRRCNSQSQIDVGFFTGREQLCNELLDLLMQEEES